MVLSNNVTQKVNANHGLEKELEGRGGLDWAGLGRTYWICCQGRKESQRTEEERCSGPPPIRHPGHSMVFGTLSIDFLCFLPGNGTSQLTGSLGRSIGFPWCSLVGPAVGAKTNERMR